MDLQTGTNHIDFDPAGDVVLVLQNIVRDIARWEADHEPRVTKIEPKGLVDDSVVKEELPVESHGQVEDDKPVEAEKVELRVSSRHLILASSYFGRMFNNDWNESVALRLGQSFRTKVDDWDVEAMCILMNIIHGHTRRVPKSIDLEMLAKLAVLVDYYECLEAVEMFSDLWIKQLKSSMPQAHNRDIILWICISWVFGERGSFKAATSSVLKQAKEPIQDLELPIPARIIRAINQQREDSIQHAMAYLQELSSELHNSLKCSFACSSMLLGALMKHMREMDIDLRPDCPFRGISLQSLTDSISSMSSPKWYDVYRGKPHQHPCTLEQGLEPCITVLKKSTEGLALADFVP